jgi:hypothetical protein
MLLAAGALLGVAVAVLGWRALRPELAGRAPGAVAGIAVAALAVAVGAAPFLGWRIVQDLRYTTSLPRSVVERIVPYENDLDTAAFDLLETAIPAGETFYVATSPEEEVFADYVRAVLLPQIAVADPASAQWIVTLGVDPRTLGPRIADVEEITARDDRQPSIYVARVAS